VELGGGGVRPPARDFAKLTALPGGRLLLFGGLDASEKRLDDAWLFDAAT
jgi:Galactose oxidase, central domain